MKKLLIAVFVILAIAVGAILFIGRTYFPDNVAETTEDGGKKGLKTRHYYADVKTVKTAAKDVAGKLSSWGGSWKIVDETDGGENAGVKIEIPVVMFTDDFEVKITSEGEIKTKVNVRSASRVGKSDFGENRRNVDKFLIALDEAMKR